MPFSYVSRDALKTRLGITDTTDDAVLKLVLEGVARAIDNPSVGVGRTFRTYLATLYYPEDDSRRRSGSSLLLRHDLLAITTLKTDDDDDRTYETTWAATDYDLLPFNAAADLAPFWELRTAPNGRYSLPTYLNSVEIVGKWGFWEDLVSVGTLGGTISATTVSGIPITAGHSVEALQTLLIEAEQVYVTSVSGNVMNIERSQNGTHAAVHAQGLTMRVYRYPADVVEAVVIQAARMFRRKDAPFGVTGSTEFGQGFVVARLDPDVRSLLAPYRHPVVA